MRRIHRWAWLLVLPLLAVPVRAAGPDEEDLAEPVRKAIERGRKYLLNNQHGGHWENQGFVGNPGGITALAALALLNAGVPPEDAAIQDALKYLRGVKPDRTYVVSLQTMVFALARQPADLERIGENVKWLLDARVMDGGNFQGWGYSKPSGPADNSNTQYALLALHEGHLAGARVPDDVWKSI